MSVAMQETATTKLRRISIKDYKGIDHLELDFPAPDLPGDPDVFVIGSENGLGKTSVLECCALSLKFCNENNEHPKFRVITELIDILVRAGKSRTIIDSTYSNNKTISLMISNQKDSQGGYDGYKPTTTENGSLIISYDNGDASVIEATKNLRGWDFVREICGFSPNPIIDNNLLFFHSYRKVAEGNPRFGTLLNGKQLNGNGAESLTSVFKRTALFSMMSNAGLFDSPQNQNTQETLHKLDDLLEQYAGCRFAKLRQTQNDSIELRVQPVNGSEAFNFDGLSSGQKEIITTLFLIWHETRNHPKVVLIDEPELHLNSQWHRSFINSLFKLAPQNQYIIATHSATIMDSVNRNRRILLQKDKETVQ